MSNFKRIFPIFLIFLVVCLMNFVSVKAVDLNLTENTSSDINSSNELNEDTENYYNSSNETTNETEDPLFNEDSSQDLLSSTTSATVKTGNLSSSTDLTVTNILNIFLIVIGIILILLAIAILIRLKK